MLKRMLCLTLLFICFSSQIFADNIRPVFTVKKNGNHIRYEYTNPEHERAPLNKLAKGDYSAHIIDINGHIDGNKTSCDDIKTYLHDQMFYEIFENPFFFSVLLDCEPDSKGMQFQLRSLINPTNEKSADISERFVKKWEGADFYGSKIFFQNTKVIMFTLVATIGESLPEPDSLIRHFISITTKRFPNLFESENAIDDVFFNFQPKDEKTLPIFLNLFPADGQRVLAAIHQSNALEIYGYPTILYGENLKEYETMIGQQWVFMDF